MRRRGASPANFANHWVRCCACGVSHFSPLKAVLPTVCPSRSVGGNCRSPSPSKSRRSKPPISSPPKFVCTYRPTRALQWENGPACLAARAHVHLHRPARRRILVPNPHRRQAGPHHPGSRRTPELRVIVDTMKAAARSYCRPRRSRRSESLVAGGRSAA